MLPPCPQPAVPGKFRPIKHDMFRIHSYFVKTICTDQLEGMLDDHLPVGIWYSWEEIPERSVGLRIVFLLGVRYRFWLP